MAKNYATRNVTYGKSFMKNGKRVRYQYLNRNKATRKLVAFKRSRR